MQSLINLSDDENVVIPIVLCHLLYLIALTVTPNLLSRMHFIHNGKQNHFCKDCGRQFVKDPQNKVISDETKALIDKLLLEKIPLAGIVRVTDISEPWLQGYVNEKYASVPCEVKVRLKKRAFDD